MINDDQRKLSHQRPVVVVIVVGFGVEVDVVVVVPVSIANKQQNYAKIHCTVMDNKLKRFTMYCKNVSLTEAEHKLFIIPV